MFLKKTGLVIMDRTTSPAAEKTMMYSTLSVTKKKKKTRTDGRSVPASAPPSLLCNITYLDTTLKRLRH